MAYTYPENRLEIIDGALRPVQSIPKDVVLIIERSYKGPSNTLYLVNDLSTARTLYGSGSPLIKLANKVYASGAKNIALFRIGGSAFEYVDLFGPNTSLRLTEESTSAADNISVYIGPEPKNKTRDAVIVYEGDRIIYSNVIGGEVYTSRVQVAGFDKFKNTLRIGSLQKPTPFKDIINSLGGGATATGITATKENVDSEEWVKVSVSDINGFKPGEDDLSTIVLTKTGENTPVNYTVSTDKQHLLINKYIDGSSENVKPQDTLEAKFLKKLDAQAVKDKGIIYTKGKDGLNATWKELYETVDSALETLDLVTTKAIVVGDWFLAPNIANGDTGENRLTYLTKGEDEDGYSTYSWSENKLTYRKQGTTDETTLDVSQAEVDINGKPVVVVRYNEVDFAHRLGLFAQTKLADGNYLNIVIGAKGPASRTPRSIANWVGKRPEYSLDRRIIKNGTGLLGHKFMVGTTEYSGGYFLTDSGFPDGEVLVDSTGFPVDLGKHISVVISQVGSSAGLTEITSGAPIYAGMIANLGPGESTTNRKMESAYLALDLKESQRQALSEAGYVVFQDKPKGLVVYSGELATRENSDYDYISTAITISEVARVITETTDPFLGRGIGVVELAALQTQLTTALSNAQKAGWFISYDFSIRRGGPNTLLIPFVIEAKDELRQIRNIVRLTRAENFMEV